MNPIPRTGTVPLCLVLAALLLAGCGKSPAAPTAATAVGEPAAATPTRPAGAAAPGADAGSLAGRSGTLNNPDNATMVFLYYDLAGIAPPVDQWVEADQRVRYAPGADKAARRAAVRAEFEAGLAAVRGVGMLQFTLQANLSSYDPTYGEFTVGALSPGAVYTFKAQEQTVNLKFDNALAAQSWSVPKDQAQAIVDRIGNDSLLLDATVHIRKVLPGPGGGTVVAHVDSWSLRDSRSGSTVARVTTRD
ncbi:hypothetical protein ACFCQI_17970 [Rhodanobacter sp. FW102-FHT14D06]|uniref:DUF3313 domain-containing protein n=2 Tax=unclassified Rhodanobacter TaxID=2621553 RepID=A0AB74UT17_9GAMM